MIVFDKGELLPFQKITNTISIKNEGEVVCTSSFCPDLKEKIISNTANGFNKKRGQKELSLKGIEFNIDPDTRLLVGNLLEDVIGRDDRNRVENTKQWPYSPLGQLIFKVNNDRISLGSGVLISRNHVLTAAHCLYHNKYGGWIKEIQFSPAQNGEEKPFKFSPGTRCFCPQEWIENHIEKPSTGNRYDIGIVCLKDPLGDQCGHYGIAAVAELANRKVSLTGYPGEGLKLFTQTDVIANADDYYAHYDLDTEEGQSGSAVYTANLTSDDVLEKVLAIHTSSPNKNRGIRINQDMFNAITQIIRDN